MSTQDIVDRIVEMRKDAERYRWLKQTNGEPFRDELEIGEGAVGPVFLGEGGCSATSLAPAEMDAAIDAAMKRWPA